MLAPNPVKPLLRHAKRDDDVDMVAVVLLGRVLECGRHPVAFGRVVVDEVRDLECPAVIELDELKPRRRVRALPFAERFQYVLDFADLVLGAFPRIHAGNVDDRFLGGLQNFQNVFGIGAGIEEISDIEPL